ncbi:hypothetical protein BN9982_40019 [Mycobacterium tuberculosis]|nr:hypothetical protein BN9982_40019 [Mycobacterium tuberculosis]
MSASRSSPVRPMPGDHRLGSRFRLGRDGIEFWRWTVRGVVGSLTRHQNGCQYQSLGDMAYLVSSGRSTGSLFERCASAVQLRPVHCALA